MITIITDMTDTNIFKDYWMPLIYRHHDTQFIFSNTEGLKPPVKSLPNVKFFKEQLEKVIDKAQNKMIYITVQDEIPTYQLMLSLQNPVEGIVPKIHGTKEESKSFTVKKDNYPNYVKSDIQVTTYKI